MDLPKVSDTTLGIMIFDTVNEFWNLFFSLERRLVSLNLFLVHIIDTLDIKYKFLCLEHSERNDSLNAK